MSEALSGLVQQTFKQAVEDQSVKQQSQPTQTKQTFESHLQRQEPVQENEQIKTSGSQMQQKLDQMQSQLAETLKRSSGEKMKPNEMPKELLDSKSRLGLLREAYNKMGSTELSGGFQGRLIQTESEYKEVEAMMKSDKNLSPGELLALQARLYQVSQHIEVMSKVVDQMAGGIKTVLNTNL